MAAKNKRVPCSEIPEARFGEPARLFCAGLGATQPARVAGLDRNTADRLLMGVNGAGGFQGCARARLGRFRGLRKGFFPPRSKECGSRFNHRHEGLCPLALEMCRKNPLS